MADRGVQHHEATELESHLRERKVVDFVIDAMVCAEKSAISVIPRNDWPGPLKCEAACQLLGAAPKMHQVSVFAIVIVEPRVKGIDSGSVYNTY